MIRYIDADKLEKDGWSIQRIRQASPTEMVYETKKPTDFPAADVVEVRHGKWIETTVPELWECSVCGCVIYSETEIDRNIYHKWCGRCGAKIDEAEE